MTKLEKLLNELEIIAKNYNKTEYCECGCKGSKAHSGAGKQKFENFIKYLKPEEVFMLVEAARGTIADNILLESIKKICKTEGCKLPTQEDFSYCVCCLTNTCVDCKNMYKKDFHGLYCETCDGK